MQNFLTDKKRIRNQKIRTKSFKYLKKETKKDLSAYEAGKIF